MKMSVEDPDQCLACDSPLQEIEAGIESPICPNCGLVAQEAAKLPTSEIQRGSQLTEEGTDVRGGSIVDAGEWWSGIDVKDSSDQRLVDALNRMDALAEALVLGPSTRIRAAEVVTEAWEQRFMHGRREDTTLGASVYAACREHGCPRPIGTVAEAANVSQSELQSTYRTLTKELEIRTRVTQASEYVPYLRKQLNLSHQVETESTEVLDELQSISGNPSGIAAAALYVVANANDEPVSYRKAGQAAGVTKETVWRKATALGNQRDVAD